MKFYTCYSDTEDERDKYYQSVPTKLIVDNSYKIPKEKDIFIKDIFIKDGYLINNADNKTFVLNDSAVKSICYLYLAKYDILLSASYLYHKTLDFSKINLSDSSNEPTVLPATSLRDILKILRKKGAPLDSQWPYVASRVTLIPKSTIELKAFAHKLNTGYFKLSGLSQMLEVLLAGNIFAFNYLTYFDLYKSLGDNFIYNVPTNLAEKNLSSAVCVGYNLETRMFKCKESLPYFGDDSYFYIPFDIMTNERHCNSKWVI